MVFERMVATHFILLLFANINTIFTLLTRLDQMWATTHSAHGPLCI